MTISSTEEQEGKLEVDFTVLTVTMLVQMSTDD